MDVDWTEILESIDAEIAPPMPQSDAKQNLRELADEIRIRIEGLADDEDEKED